MYAIMMIKMHLKQARKYKSLGLEVQRRTAVDFALYYRRLKKGQSLQAA